MKTPKIKCVIDDGFNSELTEDAFFDGIFEIPQIKPPAEIIIPDGIIPFSERRKTNNFSEFIAFYEHDVKFSNILQNAEEFIDVFARFKGMISPDFSLYRDMPLTAQIANTYRNRALGYYFQKHGIYVIPNVRWGDERSYTNSVFPEKFAFSGIPKYSIVSIGTYGCVRGRENCYHFRAGLEAMLQELSPKIVLVYGSMGKSVFGGLETNTEFLSYPDWISSQKGGY